VFVRLLSMLTMSCLAAFTQYIMLAPLLPHLYNVVAFSSVHVYLPPSRRVPSSPVMSRRVSCPVASCAVSLTVGC